MKAKPFLSAWVWCSLPLGAALPALAESHFQIAAHTDRGGAGSSGGSISVLATVGQSDAAAANGGEFALSGGFWSTIGESLPRLTIRQEVNQVVLSWPIPFTGFQLQESSPIVGSGWTNVGALPSLVGDKREVRLILGRDSQSFRLYKP